jgi:biopolymer transport protein ExbD
MDLMFKPKRHDIQEPQLATMIDVFSMLIIFLIAGTVMGVSSIVLPNGLTVPKSISKEAMLTAPQMTVTPEGVTLGFSQDVYPLAAFESGGADLDRFKDSVRTYLATQKGKADVGLVNLVADKSVTYKKIFGIVRASREAGFSSVLFVSTSRSGK